MATLISQIKGFVTSQNKAGSRGLGFALAAIEHMFQHKDWTPLAWLMAKTDPRDASVFKAIVRECVGGIRMTTKGKKALEQPSGMHITLGDNFGPTEKMQILRDLVTDGESFRGQRVKEELLGKEKPEFDFHKFVVNAMKKIDNSGHTLKDFLDEVGKVKKEQAQIDVTKPEAADNKRKAA